MHGPVLVRCQGDQAKLFQAAFPALRFQAMGWQTEVQLSGTFWTGPFPGSRQFQEVLQVAGPSQYGQGPGLQIRLSAWQRPWLGRAALAL